MPSHGNSKHMPGVFKPPRTTKHHWRPPLVPAQQGVWPVGVGRPAQKIPFHRVCVYHSRRRPFPCLLSFSLGLHNLLGHHCCLRVLLFCFCLTTSPRSQLIAVRSTRSCGLLLAIIRAQPWRSSHCHQRGLTTAMFAHGPRTFTTTENFFPPTRNSDSRERKVAG